MTVQDRRDAVALLVLRLGLVWFIFLWAVHKIFTPGQYRALAKNFDEVTLSLTEIYVIGGFQIALCLLAAIGIFRFASYGTLAGMHLYTISRRWDGFLDPFAINDSGFPVNRNQVIDLAVMGAFIALLLMIPRDHWSLGGWLQRRNGPRWWQ